MLTQQAPKQQGSDRAPRKPAQFSLLRRVQKSVFQTDRRYISCRFCVSVRVLICLFFLFCHFLFSCTAERGKDIGFPLIGYPALERRRHSSVHEQDVAAEKMRAKAGSTSIRNACLYLNVSLFRVNLLRRVLVLPSSDRLRGIGEGCGRFGGTVPLFQRSQLPVDSF